MFLLLKDQALKRRVKRRVVWSWKLTIQTSSHCWLNLRSISRKMKNPPQQKLLLVASKFRRKKRKKKQHAAFSPYSERNVADTKLKRNDATT